MAEFNPNSLQSFDIRLVDIEFVGKLPCVPIQDVQAISLGVSGVYFIYMAVPDVKVLYVGSSVNVYTRLNQGHDVMPTARMMSRLGVPIFIGVARLEWEEEDIRCAEAICIKKLTPPLNRVGKKKADLEVDPSTVNQEAKTKILETMPRSLSKTQELELRKMAEALGIHPGWFPERKSLINALSQALEIDRNFNPNPHILRRKSDLPEKFNKDSVEQISRMDLDALSIRQLRKIASGKIRNYSYMSKEKLAESIRGVVAGSITA